MNFNLDLDLIVPKNIRIINDKYHKIISKDNINKNKLIYQTELAIVNDDKIEITLNEKTYKIDTVNHTYLVNNLKYFTQYDCFMNHSCDPNTRLVLEKNKIKVCSIKNIIIGEELTCDYNNDIEEFSKLGNVTITDSFVCNCGKENCQKIIYC